MNKQRKNEIIKIVSEMESILSKLHMIQAQEQDYFDNIPENLASSIRAIDSEEALEIIEETVTGIEEAIGSLSGI